MVTASDSKQESNDLERRTRNAFNIGLLITAVSVLVVTGTALMQFQTGDDYYVGITAVLTFSGTIFLRFTALTLRFIHTPFPTVCYHNLR